MSRARQAAVAVGIFRIAYGIAIAAAPGRTTRSWLGSDGERPGAQVAIRALGAREILLHTGAIFAARAGQPVRPWLIASVGGDCADILATLASASGLPKAAAPKTAVVAGASAAISAAVVVAVDS